MGGYLYEAKEKQIKMPYLTQQMKQAADNNPLFGRKDPGVLNYRLTRTIIEWIGKEPLYSDFNAAIGALECVKQELIRRSLSVYEDEAIKRNGDVYPPWLLKNSKADNSDTNVTNNIH